MISESGSATRLIPAFAARPYTSGAVIEQPKAIIGAEDRGGRAAWRACSGGAAAFLAAQEWELDELIARACEQQGRDEASAHHQHRVENGWVPLEPQARHREVERRVPEREELDDC